MEVPILLAIYGIVYGFGQRRLHSLPRPREALPAHLRHVQRSEPWQLLRLGWDAQERGREEHVGAHARLLEHALRAEEGGDLRLLQMRSCLQDFYSDNDATHSPLFGAHRVRIQEALQRSGAELPGVAPVEEEVSEWLKNRTEFGRACRRVSMFRFLWSVAVCCANAPLWSVDEFERTYFCLELDFLDSKKLGPIVLRGRRRHPQRSGRRFVPPTTGRQWTMRSSEQQRRTPS